MRRIEFQHHSLGSGPFANWAPWIRRVLLILFLLAFALVYARLFARANLLPNARWPEGILVVLSTATLIASLSRHLPAQNVMLASIIIAVIAGAVQSLGALTAIPFGPYVYTKHFGQLLFYPLPWAVPLMWIAFILSSRGAARLILRPWRNTSNYGFRLIALTMLLVLLLDLGLEPFATRVKHYWFWNPTKLPYDWFGTPAINFFGWATASLLILAFATPSLINKRPGPPPRPDYVPLFVWLLLNALFATSAALQQLWPAVGVVCAGSGVVSVFAFWGSRWRERPGLNGPEPSTNR